MDPPEPEKKMETNQKKEKKSIAKKGKEEFKFQIYNSFTQEKEVFKSKVDKKVRMYVCGVTAYDLSHLGHARAAVCFDVLYRYLEHLGYEVTYVRNFTDVDDKIIRRANESGEDPLALSKRFCEEYLMDMSNLQCRLPTHQPKVSEHMDQIKRMIKKIIDNGYGYVIDGDVLFSVDRFPDYGKLSGQKLENHRTGERVYVHSRKRNPADFALWKAAKPGEPCWESEWGTGRPGWHIECSAMSEHYLTYEFDIHGGGIDLIFPHHENEIAQSCAACPESSVTYWMHNGHVTNNNEKMSKSLGNFFTIREITQRYHPLALRHFLISAAHYRSPLNYTIAQLENSSDIIFYAYQTLKDCESALLAFQAAITFNAVEQRGKPAQASSEAQECINKLQSEFEAKMSDDLNASPVLTGTFTEALRFINNSLNKLKKQQLKQQLSTIRSLTDVQEAFKKILGVFGLLPPDSYDEVLQQLKDKALLRAEMMEDNVQLLISKRADARRANDFSSSDQIRADLAIKGIALMDIGSETIWRPCDPFKQQKAPTQPSQLEEKKAPAETPEPEESKSAKEEMAKSESN